MGLELLVEPGAIEASPGERTLARIGFGKEHALDQRDPRSARVGLPPLSAPDPIELWTSRRPVEAGRHGEIAYGSDGRFVFGHLLLDENGHDLEAASRHAYGLILDFVDAFGRLHLLRAWNYLRHINQDQAGLERYRSFCIGRHRAFEAGTMAEPRLPAACAVGCGARGLLISFLAAPEAGRQIENPRQVSAFRYPPQYGPKSPSFSRAIGYRAEQSELLFLSGTASIVGHQTMHAGSIPGQLEETCRNLDAVMAAAGGEGRLSAIRLYLRHAGDWPELRAACRRRLGRDLPIVALHSAICRSDLLLEIDGLAWREDGA